MKKLMLSILLISSVTHAEKLVIIPKYSESYYSKMFLDTDTIHSGKIKGISRLNTTPTGQYVIDKYEVDCKARKFHYPKGRSITYNQYGSIVNTKENDDVPVWNINPSDNTVFSFLYNKYCKKIR